MSRRTKRAKKLWFRAKTYGWGWFPITWQGWLVTFVYTLLFTLSCLVFVAWLGSAQQADATTRDLTLGTAEFLAVIAILTYTLYRICRRYGEKPRWRWGKDT